MNGPLDDFRRILGNAGIQDSMLFLAHLLAVIRGNVEDPVLERSLSRLKNRPPEFLVHFVTKWLLIEGQNSGLYDLNWDRYKRLQDLYFQLDDPIVHDPEWVEGESSGFFERMFGHQLPAQERFTTRDFGLALGLFRDCGTPRNPDEYDLRSELEVELGLTIEQFMAMGILAMNALLASHNGVRVRGTMNLKYFEKARRDGIFWCTPEAWEPFLKRAVCTPEAFRACRSRKGYQVDDPAYLPFEFNPLLRYPVIDIGYGRLVAVDPELIAKRVSWGLYFDLMEKRGKAFSDDFGDVFARLVGELLSSVHPAESLWSDAGAKALAGGKSSANMPKRGDWAFKGRKYTILFECKSMQPTLELRHYGSRPAIRELRKRMVSGLRQVVHQAKRLERGDWADEGLPPAQVVCVLVSYGKYYSVRLPWFRDRIQKELEEQRLGDYPFVVLSLEELDTVVRLTELGVPMDEFFYKAAQEHGAAGLIRSLEPTLANKITASTFAHSRYEDFERRFIDSLPKPK